MLEVIYKRNDMRNDLVGVYLNTLEIDSTDTGTLLNLGTCEARSGNTDSARRHFERAIAIHEKAGMADHPDNASALARLASIEAEERK